MKKQLLIIKKEIEELTDYRPSQKVNKLFGELVKLATSLKKKDISMKLFFQQAASKAEVEMEKYWADKILRSVNPWYTLRSFWYYKNYLDLTKLEFGSLSLCHEHKKHNSILFVGSGPLPLTGIFLAKEFKCAVTFLDIDQNSLDMSKKLCEKLNMDNCKFIHADATKFEYYKNYDTIFIAAMIDSEQMSKEMFISKLAKKVRKHTHILVRSVFHNRELLYKKFDASKAYGLKPILEVRPKNDIVNSFHVFEK